MGSTFFSQTERREPMYSSEILRTGKEQEEKSRASKKTRDLRDVAFYALTRKVADIIFGHATTGAGDSNRDKPLMEDRRKEREPIPSTTRPPTASTSSSTTVCRQGSGRRGENGVSADPVAALGTTFCRRFSRDSARRCTSRFG